MSYADIQPTIVSLPPIVAATQPATGALGQVWINTTTNTPMFWDGTTWKAIAAGGAGDLDSLSDVISATAAAGDVLVNDGLGKWVATPKWVTAPANKTDPGTPGQMAYDSTHIYMCVATNSWIRFNADHAGGW